MKPFRWWLSHIYWEDISVERPSYLSRIFAIGLAVAALVLFVALFYDPAEAHRSHTPDGYAAVEVLSMAVLFLILLPPGAVVTRLPAPEPTAAALSSFVLRI